MALSNKDARVKEDLLEIIVVVRRLFVCCW